MTEGRTSLSIATVVVGAIGAAIGLAVANPSLRIGGDASVEKELVDAVSRYNTMLPMMIDSETRADSLVPRPPKTVVYRFTMVKRTKAEVHSILPTMVKYLRRQIINLYKTSDSTKVMRDAGVTIVMDYYDKNGVFVTEIEVSPSDLN